MLWIHSPKGSAMPRHSEQRGKTSPQRPRHLRLVIGENRSPVSPLAQAVLAALGDDALDELADLLAPRLAARLGQNESAASPWLNAADAASYLACSRGRLYDLVQLHKLEPRRDGRRLLFRRGDLDRYLEAAA